MFRTPLLPERGDAVGARARIGLQFGIKVAVVGFKFMPQKGLGVFGPVPVGIVQGHALLRAHADAIKTVIADVPSAIKFGQGDVGALVARAGFKDGANVGRDIAFVKVADAIADVVRTVKVGKILGHLAPCRGCLGIAHPFNPWRCEGHNLLAIFCDG